MLPALEAGVVPEAVQGAQEELDADDDDVQILQQVLFQATLVSSSQTLLTSFW